MKKLVFLFPLSRAVDGKKVFINFIIYIAINCFTGFFDKVASEFGFGTISGILTLIINVYVYIGLFLLAYSFIKNTKR